jgi:glutamate-5-semialdehyde dehydrogenase
MSVPETNAKPETDEAIRLRMIDIGRRARSAAGRLAQATSDKKNTAIAAAAAALRRSGNTLLAANAQDLEAARSNNLTPAMADRLKLDEKRIEGIAQALDNIKALPDPIGSEIEHWTRPNGLKISKVRVPLGVIGIIYESRPNVTADAGALCLKSGNAVILRGGSEAIHSSRAIHACLIEGLRVAGLPEDSIQLVPTIDRRAVGVMLGEMTEFIDVMVPRGGKSLIARVQKEARIPVIGHLEGLCHVYVDKSADLEMAKRITVNAKMRRTGICGAAETLLVDKACAQTHLKPLIEALIAAGCAVRGDAATQATDKRVTPATEEDWRTEYLDAIISVRIVDGVSGAAQHIETYGSHHTEAIIAEDASAVEAFLSGIDSAILLHNASTQFADGGEFGMGAEIGISTSKIHARGPVGARELTSYKFIVRGNGQIRP